LITCFGLLTVVSGVSYARLQRSLTNPSLQSPINTSAQRATRPVTSYQSGLVRSPNPVNDDGNRIVTGNIGGGKHFRGTVPYNAISDFGGRLGSGTLDDFLRRSTVSSDYYRGGTIPFYSQTGTVTRVIPGTNMVVMPQSSRIRTQSFQQQGGFSPLTLPRADTQATQASASDLLSFGRLRFLPIGTEPIDLVPEEAEAPQDKKLAEERYQIQLKQFEKQLDGLRQDATELQEVLAPPEAKTLKTVSLDRQKDSETESQQTTEPAERVSIYEQMIQDYQKNREEYEQIFPDEAEKDQQQKPVLEFPLRERRKLQYKQAPSASPDSDRITDKSKERPQTEMSEIDIQARVQRVIGEYKTFAAYTEDRFNIHLKNAENHMKQGKFYLAADAYSLASIYKPDDPLPYAGKSHALFAAGEYLSSALCLSRAIEIFPAYTDFKIDIVSMIGNKDTVEKRIKDLDDWYQVSSSGELKFLQAYIYLQLGRFDNAGQAIEIAHEKMPDVTAVEILKQAIENRIKQQ